MNFSLDTLREWAPLLMVIGGWLVSIEFRLRQFKIEIDKSSVQSDKIMSKLDDMIERMIRLETKIEK